MAATTNFVPVGLDTCEETFCDASDIEDERPHVVEAIQYLPSTSPFVIDTRNNEVCACSTGSAHLIPIHQTCCGYGDWCLYASRLWSNRNMGPVLLTSLTVSEHPNVIFA